MLFFGICLDFPCGVPMLSPGESLKGVSTHCSLNRCLSETSSFCWIVLPDAHFKRLDSSLVVYILRWEGRIDLLAIYPCFPGWISSYPFGMLPALLFILCLSCLWYILCWVQRKDWVYLEELHGGNLVKEKIESLLLGMDDVVVTIVQVGSDGCSRNT